MEATTTLPRPVAKYLAGLRPEDQAAITPVVHLVHENLLAGTDTGQIVQLLGAKPLPTPESELALLEALSRLAHPQIPAILQAHFAGATDKTRRKALKKALHHLKAQGLEIPPEPAAAAASSLVRPLLSPTPVKSYMSRIEGNGSRMVILHLPRQGGQPFNLFLALCNDVEGLKDAYAVLLSNKETKNYLAETRRDMPGELVEIPPSYALAMIEASFQVNPDQSAEAAKIYRQVRNRLHDAVTETAPDIRTLLPVLDNPEEYAEQARDLTLQEDFLNWYVSPEKLAPWLEKIQEIEKSPLVLTSEQKVARMEQTVDEALKEVFPPQQRQIISRRLLEMAYYLDQTGKPHLARQAQAAGEDLLRERSPLERENQFLLGLLMFTLREMYDEAKEERQVPPPQSQGRIITDF